MSFDAHENNSNTNSNTNTNSCKWDVETIEESALGLLEDQIAIDEVEAHLAACAICQELHAQMVEEHALFERRAAVITASNEDAPPFLAPDLFDAIPDEERRPFYARLMPAVVAVAACAAMFAGVAQLDRGSFGASSLPAHLDVEPAAMQTRADSFGEEPASCAWPASGIIRSFDRAGGGSDVSSHDLTLASWSGASSFASNDRGLCEDLRSIQRKRVTSSVATP